MDKAAWVLSRRQAVARRYDELLPEIPWLRPPHVPDRAEHSYQSYVCLFAPEDPTSANLERLNNLRNEILMIAEDLGVSTRQGTHAVHGLGWYRKTFGYAPEDLPKAWMAEHLTMTLPLYPQMTDEEQDYVIEVLQTAYARATQ